MNDSQNLATIELSNASTYQVKDMMGSLLEGCQIISPEWRYLYVNDAVCRQAKRTREQLLGRTMMEVFPGIETTPMFSLLRQCLEDQLPRNMENQFVYPDGSDGWFELRFNPIPEGVFVLSVEITKRRHFEEKQRLMLDVLQLINSAESWQTLLNTILEYLKKWSGCEAIGIRIKDGPDFPYFQTSGFSESFVRKETYLCSYDDNGEVRLDDQGKPIIACMCGNVLCGRFDPSKSFFTTDGSFWSNCTTDLLATTTDEDRLTRTRNRCNSSGYESVALIPLQSGKNTIGLIQLNDKQKGRFTKESIVQFRWIADNIANFIAKKQAELKVEQLNSLLHGIRKVNQLITREKNKDRLIRKACDILVESGEFNSAVIVLTNRLGKNIITHVRTGQKLEYLQKILESGTIPDCSCQAMTDRAVILRKKNRKSCRQCPVALSFPENEETLIIDLTHNGKLSGFMMTSLSLGLGDGMDEQLLLREVADDIAFALHGIEVEEERDKSTEALASTEEQLRQAQKLEAIGRLAGGVAHDYNNLLMVQLGYCELMDRKLKREDPLVKHLEQIRACANRAESLTRQLLAFSRKQTLQPEVLDLNSVVTDIEKMLPRLIGEDIEFIVDLADDLEKVLADPSQIEQIIMNLAVNARDAMPQGGKLIIETANVSLDEKYVRNHIDTNAGPHVVLAITDTGIGMDETTKSKIFEPFFTTKSKTKGTGLGLATVYGIVKQSGGSIWVYSELGKGTTFKIYLPSVNQDIVKRDKVEKGIPQGKGEKVLVVEDEPTLRDLIAQMVEELGYRVIVAANGGEALILFEEEESKPSLVITDVVMPGISGKVLVDRLHRIQPDLRTIYTSGYTDDAIVHHGVLDPGTPFLQKPFSIDELAIKIHEVLYLESPKLV
jgi:PAS domain S-box-containing protein